MQWISQLEYEKKIEKYKNWKFAKMFFKIENNGTKLMPVNALLRKQSYFAFRQLIASPILKKDIDTLTYWLLSF